MGRYPSFVSSARPRFLAVSLTATCDTSGAKALSSVYNGEASSNGSMCKPDTVLRAHLLSRVCRA